MYLQYGGSTLKFTFLSIFKGAESRHNLSYWNGIQYIGVGPGAHGR